MNNKEIELLTAKEARYIKNAWEQFTLLSDIELRNLKEIYKFFGLVHWFMEEKNERRRNN